MSAAFDQGNTLWKDVLKQQLVFLDSNLNVNDIYSHLIRDKILTIEQGEDVKKAKCSPRFQAERLLAHISKKRESEFNAFVKILEECHHKHLAKAIKAVNPEMEPTQPHWKHQLQNCQVLIANDLRVSTIKSELIQEGIINLRQAEEIMSEPDPTSQPAKMRLFLEHLLNRSETDFDNFLLCFKKESRHVHEEIENELRQLKEEKDSKKRPFWQRAIRNKMEMLTSDLVIREFSDGLIAKGVLDQDKLEECTQVAVRTRKMMACSFVQVLLTKEKRHYDLFMNILQETENNHLATPLKLAEDKLRQEYADNQREREPPSRTLETPLSQQIAQETDQPGSPRFSPLLPAGRNGGDTSDGAENLPLGFSATQPTDHEVDSLCGTLEDAHIDEEGATGGHDVTDSVPTGKFIQGDTQAGSCVGHPSDANEGGAGTKSEADMCRAELAGLGQDMRNLMMEAQQCVGAPEGQDTKWDDLIGLGEVKMILKTDLIYPLQKPNIYKSFPKPEGYLFYGPPGTGKTMLAKAIATNTSHTFIHVTAADVVSKYLGDSAKLMKCFFKLAESRAPSVLFFDEIDSLTSRGDDDHQATRQMLTQFLTLSEGFHTKTGNDRPIIIGTTNVPWKLDDAVKRRLPTRIYIPLPNVDDRVFMLKKYLTKAGRCASDITEEDYKKFSVRTERFSAGDIALLAKNSARMALAQLTQDHVAFEALDDKEENAPTITKDMVDKSLQKMDPSCDVATLKTFEEFNPIGN